MVVGSFVSHCPFEHSATGSRGGSGLVIVGVVLIHFMVTWLPHSLQETGSLVFGIQSPSEVVNSGVRQDVCVTYLNNGSISIFDVSRAYRLVTGPRWYALLWSSHPESRQ